MRRVTLRAALLLASAGTLAVPVLAQQATQQTTPPKPVSGPRDRSEILLPEVPARSTAAQPAVLPPTPEDPRRPVLPYRPDGGGPLSGLPYDRKATVVPDMAPVTTLTQAITLAYRTNPDLLAARAQARSADYRVPQARSGYGPNLSANGFYTFTRTRQELTPGSFVGNQGWTSTASAILTQPVFTFGRNAASEAGAQATSTLQRDLLRVSESQVLGNVVFAYVSVLREATSVTIARQNLAILERQLTDNQQRYEVRDLTQTDLDQTRTRVEFGRAQLLEAEGRLGVAQKQFLQFVGAPPGELAQPDLLDIRFGSLAAAYSYAEVNSGLIRAAQSREKISRAGLQAARADSLPRVDLRGTADYGTATAFTDRLRTTQLTGQVVLSQPIIDSGLRRARTNEAREANQADWRLLDQALRETRSAIGTAWDQLASTRATLANYRAAEEAAERAYEGAALQQRAGDRSTLDVLDLARDLLTIRNSFNQALATEYLARSSLLAAAGMLEGPMIVAGLDAYDADAHYDRVRRQGDIPLFTELLSQVDGVTNSDQRTDRASRDAGAAQALDPTLPLPPAPAPMERPVI